MVDSIERRYQVFISSTYTDLKDERQGVIQSLLELDCLPAGMELFPAADDDQWTLIKQVIDESDYYIVVVGGRYGSLGPDGLSFTEMEFDYAVASGKPVMGFVHGKPDEIPAGKTQPKLQKQLDAFLGKVRARIVKEYSSPAELRAAVLQSMVLTMKRKPTEGWVRGRFALTPQTQTQIAELRARVSELERELDDAKSSKTSIPVGLAFDDDIYQLYATFTYQSTERDSSTNTHAHFDTTIVAPVTWRELFIELGPRLINEATEPELKQSLNSFVLAVILNRGLKPRDMRRAFGASAWQDSVDDVLVQFFALNLITHGIKKRSTTDRHKYWALTQLGQDTLMKLRAITRDESRDD